MIQTKTILSAFPLCLKTIDIPRLGKKQQGKVRDFYILPDKRIIITTDRQSAFDRALGHIPYKGSVLNSLAAFWFEKTKNIVPNHVISVPDPNITIAKNCTGIPVEMVIRKFITGVTDTSIWGSYKNGERTIYGLKFPEGLSKNQKLPKPIITPTTHAEKGGHDARLTREEIIAKNIVDKKLYAQMEETTYALFEYGSKLCAEHGLILVDTKYEFGLYNNELTLIDEIHTPDSSRFWIADTYEKRFSSGEEPESFDKEILRLWYADRGYKGEGKPPVMSEDLILSMSRQYIGAYEKITGKKFIPYKYPIENRIKKNILKALAKGK